MWTHLVDEVKFLRSELSKHLKNLHNRNLKLLKQAQHKQRSHTASHSHTLEQLLPQQHMVRRHKAHNANMHKKAISYSCSKVSIIQWNANVSLMWQTRTHISTHTHTHTTLQPQAPDVPEVRHVTNANSRWNAIKRTVARVESGEWSKNMMFQICISTQ